MEIVSLPVFTQTLREIEIITEYIYKQPLDKELFIIQTARELSLAESIVKDVFYVLFASRKIKATFLPVHFKCGKKLGDIEKSVYSVTYKADIGMYKCCDETIDREAVEIQMVFWRLGSKAIRGGDWEPPLISEKGKNN